MLVVDLHTLHTVYILNLVDDIFLNGSGTHDVEYVGRSDGTVGERSSGAHIVVFLNENLLRQRNEVLLDFAKLGSNRYLTVASLNLAKLNLTVDFRNDSGVGRVTCLKELGNTGQTTGDITGITCRTRNLDEYLAGSDIGTVLNHEVSAHRQCIGLNHLTVGIDDVGLGNACTIL